MFFAPGYGSGFGDSAFAEGNFVNKAPKYAVFLFYESVFQGVEFLVASSFCGPGEGISFIPDSFAGLGICDLCCVVAETGLLWQHFGY